MGKAAGAGKAKASLNGRICGGGPRVTKHSNYGTAGLKCKVGHTTPCLATTSTARVGMGLGRISSNSNALKEAHAQRPPLLSGLLLVWPLGFPPGHELVGVLRGLRLFLLPLREREAVMCERCECQPLSRPRGTAGTAGAAHTDTDTHTHTHT